METAIWSVGAALIIAALLKGVPWVVRRAVEDVVDRQLGPLANDLREHMRNEERERQILNRSLNEIKEQFRRNEVEHAAMHSRIQRLERK